MSDPNAGFGAALSALTEEDSAVLRSIASSTVLADPAEKLAEASIDKEESVYSAALPVAAFLGGFDPLRLMPNAKEGDLRKLLADCTVSTDGMSSRWTMRAGARERVLAGVALGPEGLIQGTMEAKQYLERSGEQADDVTRALLEVTGGKPPERGDFAAMSKEVLAANRAVLGWLKSVDLKLGFDAKRLLTDIEIAELLEPFRFLTGFDPNTGGDMFVGRADELRRLRIFVDALRSEGLLESVHRGSRRWIASDRRVLWFSGVGGVGKSTLLAKFILQHIDPDSDAPLRFAYLDFDRSTISAVQPATLILEMVRQVGWQLPEVRNQLEELRNRIRQEMERTRREAEGDARARGPIGLSSGTKVDVLELGEQELPPELIGSSLLNTYLYEAGQILTRNSAADVPLLLVLDTFEEAQVLGDQAVRRIEGFIEAAQEHVPRLRAVIAGRDEAAGFFEGAKRLVISEFKDLPSRIAFLEKRGLAKKSANSVAGQVGGRPLTLLLAARLVREQGLESISVSLTDRLRGLFDKYLIDGILYQRILNHIDDDDVKALAHPGLVLRRIDLEVLRLVVAPVLGLGEIPDERARRIMTALRHQKDLVRVEPDGSVTHRPDVREQMLVLMSMEKPEMVRALHAFAASYYAARQTKESNSETRDRDRIEEIYHRLSIGDSLEQLPELWFSRARLGLARSVDEIADISGRGTLKVLLGRIPTAEEVNALPVGILREYSTRALVAAMAAQEPERALAVLAEYPQFVSPELRQSIEPQAMDQSGQWVSARGLFLKLVERRGIELSPADALAAADFFERNPGRERYRDVMVGLLMDLRGLRAGRADRRRWALPLSVAALRLKVRQGAFGKVRVSTKELDLDGSEPVWPISDVPSINAQWIVTLTDEVDRRGLRLIESMPVTDTVRGQLSYLKSLLADGAAQPELVASCINISDTMRRSTTIGGALQAQWSESEQRDVVPLVLRHLMRPPTPKWYVPIACLLRREIGETVRTSDLYEDSLPELPFRGSATLRTTKSLADFLGRLDQLGVLHICLQRLLVRRRRTAETTVDNFVHAYLEWRNAMLFDVDAWFGSFERVRPLLRGREST